MGAMIKNSVFILKKLKESTEVFKQRKDTMSLYIDNDFYLEIQMLSLPSLWGLSVSIELKQRGKD